MKQGKGEMAGRIDPEKWVDIYGDALFGYALFRMQDKALAEELVQETFVAALDARKTFGGRSTEKTWLFSILKNKISDHLRKLYRKRDLFLENNTSYDEEIYFNPKGKWLNGPKKWQENPMEMFEQKEFFQVLVQCFKKLPSRQRQAFMLKELDDVESGEICKVLSIKPTNYWVLLHRGRLSIRQCLERSWFSPST